MTTSDQIKTQLTRFLQNETGRSVTVTKLWPLAGGASRETWAIDALIDDQPTPLVLRLDMASVMTANALSRADEFRLLQRAHSGGVTCPRPSLVRHRPKHSWRTIFPHGSCRRGIHRAACSPATRIGSGPTTIASPNGNPTRPYSCP